MKKATYNNDVLALLAGATAALDLNELAQDAEGGLLVVGVAVCVEGLLDLAVDDVQVHLLLLVAVITLVDETDARIDAIGSCLPHMDPMVFEGVEDEFHVSVLVEYSIEGHDGELLAEFFQDQDGAVLLHVVGLGITVFL